MKFTGMRVPDVPYGTCMGVKEYGGVGEAESSVQSPEGENGIESVEVTR